MTVTVQVICEVQRRLRAQQGELEPREPLPVLDQVLATVLSQHTSDVNSGRAFARLKARFPDWEQAADAPTEEIEDAIRCGGLARRKACRIKEILDAVGEREGRVDLSRLHDLDDRAAERYLMSLPGVGVKTAACVLAFSMGRAAFPVDTHVHRVVTRLGWIPAGTTAEKTYRLLAPQVPAGIRHDLHLALIGHGRTVCLARRPRCQGCVLLGLCPYGQAAVRHRRDVSAAAVVLPQPATDVARVMSETPHAASATSMWSAPMAALGQRAARPRTTLGRMPPYW